ncbi:TetR/AcrR family transcriptional regulator [Ruminococcus flavefaciens]|uniref:TetR family transcriptional regulator n=1 Tax=Ruminococcus flavefaciens TaxID=1265 RepID=A0A315YKX8_RUMFL|nr:TetR/AcrR family transcriptional regulator [Ruminococcus flavefaciens]PWJ12178.1 TetR family transcriptional regulator [Ruminococcus flavefaciens]SSA49668.1 transcriptional regulator, TetR family [Ruminococcus flavefaciens]
MSTPDKSIDPRLLASAEAEFNKNGFIKAELKTICENAGITTGALYKRYKGKEELFCAVVDGIVSELNDFVENRSDIDFSALSNAEIIASWTMTYESFIPMFRLLYDNRITFVLLIDKAAGTRYENFNHDFVTKLSYAYEKFYDEAKKRGLAKADVTRQEFHVLISSYWTCVCEPFIHKMSWKKIEEHCRVMCRFFNWRDVILLKGEDDV